MAEPSTFVTIALEQFAISVSHPLLMLTSLTWTSCALPAMKRHSRGAICHTMSVSEFDVPYLNHFPPPCRVTMSRRHQKLVENIFTCNSLSGNLAWIIP